MADAGWPAAVAGCDYVLHVASPLGGGPDASDETLTPPARDGRLRRSARGRRRRGEASGADLVDGAPAPRASRGGQQQRRDGLDRPVRRAGFNAYRHSKVAAERAAWDFMATNAGATEFTTVLPSAIFGPVLSRDTLGSVRGDWAAVQRQDAGRAEGRLQRRRRPRPGRGPGAGDDRSQAAGERFIACGEFVWMADIAKALRASCRRSRRPRCRKGCCPASWCGSRRAVTAVCKASFQPWDDATPSTPPRRSVSWAGRPGPAAKPSSTRPRR